MSINKEFDAITAISTPLGEGAIGGRSVYLEPMLSPLLISFKGRDLETVTSTYYHYGHIVENEETMMKSWWQPKTFTREGCRGDQHSRWGYWGLMKSSNSFTWSPYG